MKIFNPYVQIFLLEAKHLLLEKQCYGRCANQRSMLATVTETNLNYNGSITIDKALLDAVDILHYERVQVLNINNGARVETYVIEGERNSGVICLNGAAARWAQPGDRVIIISYCLMEDKDARDWKPKIILVDGDNKLIKTLQS